MTRNVISSAVVCFECEHTHRYTDHCGHQPFGIRVECECTHKFGAQKAPEPHEIAPAMVVTEWVCPFCNYENDVWGEGAVHSWMECASCGESAYLSMDAFLANAPMPHPPLTPYSPQPTSGAPNEV